MSYWILFCSSDRNKRRDAYIKAFDSEKKKQAMINNSKNSKFGNIYEIKLPNNEYVYICFVREYSFAIFNYKSLKENRSIENLLKLGFKVYKSGKETAVNNKRWTFVGKIDLIKENIQWPDLANYRFWDIEGSIAESKIIRNGDSISVPKEYYGSLVEKGLIYGFFDKPENFELWIVDHFDSYPKDINW